MKRLIKFFTTKATIISLFVLLQFAFFVVLVYILTDKVPYFFYISSAISFLLVIIILRGDEPDIYKVAWVIPILVAPIFGGLFYLTFKPMNITKKLRLRAKEKDDNRKTQLEPFIKPLKEVKSSYDKQIQFLLHDYWPYYNNTNVTFLPSGESKLKHVLDELKKAEKFIFLEYFILEEVGLTWKTIYPILVDKAQKGVDVRLIYDDFGSSTRIKRGFKKRMERAGIKTVIFNPLKLRFIVALNYRDHRKMIIVDGNVGFTGGINIADEYANIKRRFGHWHDAAVKITGDAVFSLTASFLETWDFHKKTTTSLASFKPTIFPKSEAMVIPFSDSPFSKKLLSKNIYTQMIYSAKSEIFITTPYFIVDAEILNALKNQALSGVKIHIIIPGIPDKKFAYRVTKHYLRQLINLDNIFIYSYAPGFIHSKILYVDDQVATVGTVNFDFRSFYLHYENTIWFYNSVSLVDIKSFLEKTIKDSIKLEFQDIYSKNVFSKLYDMVLVSLSHLL